LIIGISVDKPGLSVDKLVIDVLRFNSSDVDQKHVLIHPRFMSPGRADVAVLSANLV